MPVLHRPVSNQHSRLLKDNSGVRGHILTHDTVGANPAPVSNWNSPYDLGSRADYAVLPDPWRPEEAAPSRRNRPDGHSLKDCAPPITAPDEMNTPQNPCGAVNREIAADAGMLQQGYLLAVHLIRTRVTNLSSRLLLGSIDNSRRRRISRRPSHQSYAS